MALIKKYVLKIPKTVRVRYNKDNNSVILKSISDEKILKLNMRLVSLNDVMGKQKLLYVTQILCKNVITPPKMLKVFQDADLYALKKALSEISSLFCKKLKLVGVGYKAFVIKSAHYSILQLSLGHSHSVYFKLPYELQVEVTKNGSLFISGNSVEKVSSTAALIRSFRAPEPYKGKGILYFDEKIQLKIGKKV